MKALLVPIGSRGDVQPLLVLADELRRRGHDVSFATCPNFCERVRSEGYECGAIGSDTHTLLLENAALAEKNPVLALPRQLQLLREEATRQCRDLLELQLPRFDLVIGAGLSLAARLLAERQGARYSFICYSLSAVPSAAHPPSALPIFGLPGWANRGLWRLMLAAFEHTVGEPLARARSAYGLAADPEPWNSTHASNAILAQDELLGVLPSDARGHGAQVPALARAAGDAELPAHVDDFLRRGSGPRVYVGFGSMPSVQRTRVIDAVTTFAEAHAAQVLLFSAHGEDAPFELQPSVLAVGALDHARLFPRLDLVVHHGGAGTTAQALRAGVPQLIVPHIVDQFFHGRRIAELGLGPLPVKKRALRQRLLSLSWSEIAIHRERAAAIARGLAPSGAPAAAAYLECLVAARG